MPKDFSSNCLHWDAKLGVVFIRHVEKSGHAGVLETQ